MVAGANHLRTQAHEGRGANSNMAGGGWFCLRMIPGADATEGCDGGLAVESVGIVAIGDEQGRGVVGADPAAGQEGGAMRSDRLGDPLDQA